MFKTRLLIRFHHADHARVMFHANLYLLAHQAFERFIVEGAGFQWDEFFANPRWSATFRRVEADYLRPHIPGREIEGTYSITAIGPTSFDSRLDFHDLDGEHLSRVDFVNVFAAPDTLETVSVPDEARARLTPFLVEAGENDE